MGIFFQNFLSIDRFLLNKYILQMLSSRATIRVVLPMHSLPRNSIVKTKFASAKNENNKIIKVNDNWAVTKWQALWQALYLHYIIWILTIILEVGFDNFPILHTGRPFKRWVTRLRKWQSRFKLRSVLLKNPNSCKLLLYFEQNQKWQSVGWEWEKISCHSGC